jgi:predicted Zn finger-like uncharacterized protein
MKFVCDRCQTKYSIADDKVRGKVLKVRCKTCQNVITVREAGAKPSVGSLEPVRPSQRPSSGALATLGEAHEDPSERTNISAAPAGLMADLMQAGKRATPPPPPSIEKNADGIEWFLALEGAQQGPFPRKVLVDRLLALPKDSDVHVWNEGMDGWKAPADVPEIARDLEARKPPAPPVKSRVTPAPPLPATSVPPPPVGPPAARRGTMPLTSGLGGKLNLPTPHVAAAHAVPAPHGEPAAAKAPMPVGGAVAAAAAAPALARSTHASSPAIPVKKNGVGTNGTHAAAPAAPLGGGGSDPLSALNIDVATPAAAPVAGPAATKVPPAPPRLMDMGAATAWSGSERAEEGRQRNTKVLLLGAIGVVAAVVLVIAMSMTKKAPTVAATAPIKAGIDSEALGKLHDELSAQKSAAPLPVAQEPAAPEPVKGKGLRGRNLARGRQMPVVARGNALTGTTQVATQTAAVPADQNNGFKERSVTPVAAIANRPPPSQGEITRVINNNKIGIKTCYQRALLRDSSLTHGKIVVGVTIGISGRVKHVKVDGPSSFRTLEPCIREMVGRWTFPQASDEYGTEFSYLFQGNE